MSCSCAVAEATWWRGVVIAVMDPSQPAPTGARIRAAHRWRTLSRPAMWTRVAQWGGFEARRWRASHLNHRERRSREAAATRARRTRVASLSAADPSRAVGQAQRPAYAAEVSGQALAGGFNR